MVAEGYAPDEQKAPTTDPLKGPVTLTLKPHDLDRRDADLVLRGRVLDEKGKPVVNASVQPFGVRLGEHGGRFGALRGLVDPLAVTNEKGEFRLGTTKRGAPLYLEVNAPALAPQKAGWFTPGPKVHEVRLTVGVFVRGRVVKDGKPVPGIALQLCTPREQPGRRARTASGPFGPSDDYEMKIATDKDGYFLFAYVPPEREYRLWGIMDSCRNYGVVPVQKVTAGGSGTGVELGEWAMKPGHRLSGRLVLPDGKPPPAGSRVVLGLRYEPTPYGDGQLAITAADGKFTFTGLPDAAYEVTVRAPGYHVSPKNRSYANVTSVPLANGLIGRVDRDTDGLRLLLEPGPEIPRPDLNKLSRAEVRKWFEERRQRRATALQGAPGDEK